MNISNRIDDSSDLKSCEEGLFDSSEQKDSTVNSRKTDPRCDSFPGSGVCESSPVNDRVMTVVASPWTPRISIPFRVTKAGVTSD